MQKILKLLPLFCYSPCPGLANNLRLARLTLSIAVRRRSNSGLVGAVGMHWDQLVSVTLPVARTCSARRFIVRGCVVGSLFALIARVSKTHSGRSEAIEERLKLR